VERPQDFGASPARKQVRVVGDLMPEDFCQSFHVNYGNGVAVECLLDQAGALRASFSRPAPPPSDIPQQARWAASNLPESTIREEHAQSGQWRADAPAAVTGR